MSLRIERLSNTSSENKMLCHYRYLVYVEQLGLLDEADHENKLLVDDLDEYAVSYGVFDGDEPLASLRVLYLDNLPDPSHLIKRFQIESAIEAFGLSAICTTSRFILDPRLHGSKTVYHLSRSSFIDGMERGIRVNLGDCSPGLIPFYEKMGYRVYRQGFNDPLFGYKVPILMLRDWSWMRRIGSPLIRLKHQYEDDSAARLWFHRTYPDFVETRSAAFLSDEMLLDLINSQTNPTPLLALPIAQGLTKSQILAFLRFATLIKISAGDILVKPGHESEEIYLSLSGTLRTIDPPDRFSGVTHRSISTYGGPGTNSVGVMADTNCEILAIPKDSIDKIYLREPEGAKQILCNLANTWRRDNEPIQHTC